MKRVAFLGLLYVVFASSASAQDPHFSQFFSSPLTLNPALTGKFDGDFRLSGNYRNQWPTFNDLYTTYTASADFQILKKNIPENDTWGVGVLALRDQAGDNILTDTYLSLSTSYHKALDEDGFQQIGIGFQGSYGSKRLDNTGLFFEDMLTPYGFTGVTKEVFETQNLNVNYFDLNAGILYSGSTTGENNFYAGASLYHINSPRQSFLNASWNISPRATIHGGGYFPIAEDVKINVSGIAQFQNKAHEVVVGAAAAATVVEDDLYPKNVYVGAWLRLGDAIAPYFALEFSGLRIGISFDVNVSALKSASQSRGGLELSLIYVNRSSEGGRGIPCPVF